MSGGPYAYESARRRSLGSERYAGGASTRRIAACQDLG